MRSAILLLAMAGAARAACPNKCSGHGKCLMGDLCSCETRWVGLDCSERECPWGVSWVTAAITEEATGAPVPMGRVSATNPGLGGMHPYAECSNKGVCDTATGECSCFDGYTGRGCRRQKCPNDCSGHGACISNNDVNVKYATATAGNLQGQYWDATRAFQCSCDVGYNGIDCSDRMCPKGDDPMIDCPGPNNPEQVDDIQLLVFDQANENNIGEATYYGYVALKFTDMFGANYTTKPIYLGATASDHSSSIETALEQLPNFVTPNVTVNKYKYGANAASHGHRYAVTFVDDVNAGQQYKLECSYAGGRTDSDSVTQATSDFAAASPRLTSPNVNDSPSNGGAALTRACSVTHQFLYDHDGLDGSPKQLQTACERYAGATPLADGMSPSSFAVADWMTTTAAGTTATYDGPCSLQGLGGKVYEENAECSNRGTCDTSAGLCDCYEGFSGEACSSQTIFV